MTTGGLSSKGLARVRDLLERHVDAGFAPGAVAVVARHGAIHVESVGNLAFEGASSSTSRTRANRFDESPPVVTLSSSSQPHCAASSGGTASSMLVSWVP